MPRTVFAACHRDFCAAAGTVINRFAHTPYGESQTLTASWATPPIGSSAAVPWAHLFQGLEFTDVTALAYARRGETQERRLVRKERCDARPSFDFLVESLEPVGCAGPPPVAGRATFALNAAPNTRRLQAIIMLLIGCLPSTEFHFIKPPEDRGPSQLPGIDIRSLAPVSMLTLEGFRIPSAACGPRTTPPVRRRRSAPRPDPR